METANIAMAKNQLSRLLERVKRGESILITDRQRPVARLQPLGDLDPILESHFVSGLLSIPEHALDLDTFLSAPRAASEVGGLLETAIIQEREEGR